MFRIYILLGLINFITTSVQAGELDLRLESGSVSFSRNDVRIPGDSGTTFDMLELTGTAAEPYVRFYATYDINEQQTLRFTYAPLTVSGTGQLNKDVTFNGDTFSAYTPLKGSYQFNTYRVTYRWMSDAQERWHWGIGAAALIRDADIMLEQGSKRQSRDDLGLVPLLHLYGKYKYSDRTAIILDMEGAWSPMGRAVDIALKTQYNFDSGWYVAAGYRTLEGGADNEDVYTFAWLHYVMAVAGYRF